MGMEPSGSSWAPDGPVGHRATVGRRPRWDAGRRLLGHQATAAQRPGGGGWAMGMAVPGNGGRRELQGGGSGVGKRQRGDNSDVCGGGVREKRFGHDLEN
jgi:hypothetical protein